jgi:hypothetical protein
LPSVRVQFGDERVGFLHMRDAARIGRKARILGEIFAAHRL